MRALLFLIRKEFLQIRRDRAMLRLILAAPVVQLIVLGYAANLDLERVPVSVLDQDRSAASRALVDAFHATNTFVPGPPAAAPAGLQAHLVHDRADVTVWIPRHYGRDLAAGRDATVGIAVDGTNSSAGGKAAGQALQVVRHEGSRLAAEAGVAASGARVAADTRVFYNPQLVSRHYMVPGIIVILVTVISALVGGAAIVREKEIGTLEQLMVTPLTAGQIVAGKVIPFAVLGYVTLTVSTLLAVVWFGVPLVGSVGLLAGSMAAYLLVTLGVGLLASTLSSTQQQAMFTAWFFLVFGILMSGFFYPIANMPAWARLLTYANPMRYVMTIVRDVFLKGSGLADLWPQLAALTVIGAAVFTTAVARFRKRAR